jgi:carboxymethylenebutenolidase
MTIRSERVEMHVSDGTTMSGYLCRPEGDAPRPGLLILQEIFGVNGHIRDVAERYAREGFVTLAPELFHRIQPDFVGSYDDIAASVKLAMAYNESDIDLRAAAEFLSKHPAVIGDRLASLGFCMGGRLSFVANAVANLRCAVSFYGSIAPDKLAHAERLSGPMMMIWAGKDAHISEDKARASVEAVRIAGKPYVNVEFSDQNHGFFCDARRDYDAGAASQAWALSLAFLRTHLG